MNKGASLAEVTALASVIRAEIKQWAKTLCIADPNDLCGACAVFSYTLHLALLRLGYANNFVFGQARLQLVGYHCWVEIDDTIIDGTATQFDSTLPDIYVTTLGDAGYREICRNETAYNWVSTWERQSPFTHAGRIQHFIMKVYRSQARAA